MRITAAALAIAIVGLAAVLFVQQPERAAADLNVTGDWVLTLSDGSELPVAITQTGLLIECVLTLGTQPNEVIYTLQGAINPADRVTTCSGTITIDAVVSAGGHTMTGTVSSASGQSTAFTGTGGNGDPKPFPPTPTPTPGPVGGMAFDTPSGGRASDPRVLAAIVVAAFVTLGGAGLFARGRG